MNPDHRHSAASFCLRLRPVLILSALLMLVGSPGAYSQVDRATLEGTVTDSSGSVIVGAGVKAVAADTGLTEEQQTNAKGYTVFPASQSVAIR